MTDRIDVLDHGYVRLVDSMGGDISIARAARVSYDDAARRVGENEGSDTRLIGYLWRNHHTTPFESVTFTFEIKAPIFVFRQWHRHRTQSFNEVSARYSELPEEFYLPHPDVIAAQSTNNRQGRQREPMPDAQVYVEMMAAQNSSAFATYREMLARGVTRELARLVLPVATYSNMFTTMNLLNLLRFLTLRCDSHAQYEIRVYADAMRDLARSIVPVAIGVWESP